MNLQELIKKHKLVEGDKVVCVTVDPHDGADIQCKSVGSWYNILAPHWGNGVEYRIKPAKSAKDTKLEELEANMRKLADEIKELQDD